MTAKTRKQAFDESVPTMTNEQIEEGLKMGRVAVGFCAEPVMLDKEEVGFIAFRLAVAEGDTHVFLFDQFSARALGGLIETLNKADWKAAKLPGAKKT